MLCLEDNKEYTTGVKSLERIDGLGISDQDLTLGNNLIWHYRGTPYEVEVVRIQGKSLTVTLSEIGYIARLLYPLIVNVMQFYRFLLMYCLDEKPMPGSAAMKRQRVHVFDEDSSDSDHEGEVKKRGKQTKRHRTGTEQEVKQTTKKVKESSPDLHTSTEDILSTSLLIEVC